MSTRTAMLIAIGCLCAIGAPAHAVCVNGPVTQWTPESGGNGHFYQAVCAPSTWDEANADAIAMGRHLATVTSEEENDFVFSLIEDESWWANGGTYGPWIGGVQDEDARSRRAGGPGSPGSPSGSPPGSRTSRATTPPPRTTSTSSTARAVGCNPPTGTISAARSLWPTSPNGSTRSTSISTARREPLTDGVLILRRLFGFTDGALTSGAVDLADCKRCDATTIQPFLALMSAGVVHDVTADWSDFENPNGVWSYLAGHDAAR